MVVIGSLPLGERRMAKSFIPKGRSSSSIRRLDRSKAQQDGGLSAEQMGALAVFFGPPSAIGLLFENALRQLSSLREHHRHQMLRTGLGIHHRAVAEHFRATSPHCRSHLVTVVPR